LVVVDTVQNLLQVARQQFEVEFGGTPPRPDELRAVAGVQAVHADGARYVVSFAGPADPLVKALAAHDVRSLRTRDADLEEIFLRYYREDGSP
jgi:ABC-2 type transport system ATP-binding protein